MKSLEEHLSAVMSNGKKVGTVTAKTDWKIAKPMYVETSQVDAPYIPIEGGELTHLILAGQHYYTAATPKLFEDFQEQVYELGVTMVQLGMKDSFKIELPEKEYDRVVFSMAVTQHDWIPYAEKALTLDIFSNFPYWFKINGPAGPIIVGKAR